MNSTAREGKAYRLPLGLSPFQQALYVHLIEWKWRRITEEPGGSHGREYDAILPPQFERDAIWPHIYAPVAPMLAEHRKRNPFRIHKHFYHMASSQAANINLFLPLLHSPHAAEVLRAVKPDFAALATKVLDNGYCLEFWGGNCAARDSRQGNSGPLGDKSAMAGTDADIAIAYYNHAGEPCLWLIEHKLTEAEFTTCGGFKSRGRQAMHDCGKSFGELLGQKSACYYHDVRKFRYWTLTEAYRDFFPHHERYASCPFRGGMNQLWRNQLLALALEGDGSQPWRQVSFSVVRHPGNSALDETLAAWRALIGDHPRFSVFTSEALVAAAEAEGDGALGEWARWYRELYGFLRG